MRAIGTGRFTGLIAVLAAVAAVAVHVTWATADPVIGPVPSAHASITFTTPTDNLNNGDPITFHVDTNSGTTLNSVEAKICIHGSTTYSASQFSYTGSFGVRCVDQPGISSGGLGTPPTPPTDYRLGPVPFLSATTSGNLTFHAGQGTVNWTNSSGFGPAAPMTCNLSSKCDLVIDAGLNSDPAGNDTWFIQPLTYAGVPTAPDAPTALGATAGDGQASLTWTAPANNGGSAITDYQVNVSPAPASGSCSTGSCMVGSAATNFTVPNLTNFTTYSFTVQAKNLIGTGAKSNTASTQPGPPGPTGLAASAGDASVMLTWNSVGGATDYKVNVSPSPASGPCSSGSCLVGSATTTFTVPNLTNFTTYTFTVAALAGGGTTAPSSAIMAQPKPAGPTNLQATSQVSTVDLAWTGLGAATNYQVNVTPVPGGSSNCATGTCLTGSTGTTFTVTGLSPSTSYTFTVAAVETGGITAPSSNAMAQPKPPGPGGLVATAGDGSAALSWNTVSSATDYQVMVTPSPSSGPCSTGSCSVGSATTTFTVPNLTNFTVYTFTVKTKNAAGTGTASNAVTATPVPAGPTGLATSSRDAAVHLTWTATGGATDYQVTVTPVPTGTSNCSSGTCLAGTTTAAFTVTGLASGTTYSFTVAAVLPAGTTAPSSSVTGAPNVDGTLNPSTVAPGGAVTVTSTGWKASSTVAAELHSAPVPLGNLNADANGTVSGSLTLPSDTASGSHTIVLTGTDPDSQTRTVSLTLTVPDQTPTTTTTTAVGVGVGGASTGAATGTGSKLAFTGSSLRDLASLALLLIAAGLFLLHRRYRHELPAT